MEEEIIFSREEGGDAFQQLLSQYDAPAYVRRARSVALALEQLFDRCRRQRDEWLNMTRLRLGTLFALAGDENNLRPLLRDDAQLEILRRLHQELEPKLRVPVEPSSSQRILRRALGELCDSLERFNQRWSAFLPAVDLTAVNELREGYNRYYVLEKECVVRSARVARHGFARMEMLTIKDLRIQFPLLPVPEPASSSGTSR